MSSVDLVLDPRPRDLGGGLTVGRVLPAGLRRSVGPFVFLDHMGPIEGIDFAVRPHPHINLATVTYLFEGEIMHRDSLGSAQLIKPGEINWMVAGRGIAHSERPPSPSRMHGLQIWVGLPTEHENAPPTFQHVEAAKLPVIERDGARIHLLAGTLLDQASPVATMSPLFYVDVELAAGGAFATTDEHIEQAAYVIDGELDIEGEVIPARHMAVLAPGATPVIRAERPARFVMLGGAPLDGPRHLWWNFVSSSRERIVQAAEDWRAGRFPKIPGDDREFTPAPDGPHFAG